MRSNRTAQYILVLGAGLSCAALANADVVLLNQTGSVSADASSTKSDSHTMTGSGEWSASQVVYQSGTSGYWVGGNQFSNVDTGSMFADGSARAKAFGAFRPARNWSSRSDFTSLFMVGGEGQLMNIDVELAAAGTGSYSIVTVGLAAGSGSGAWLVDVDTRTGGTGFNGVLTLAPGTYQISIQSFALFPTTSSGGDAQFSMGVGFANVPGPSAIATVALFAFLRRRRV